jgi:hypothetical protein
MPDVDDRDASAGTLNRSAGFHQAASNAEVVCVGADGHERRESQDADHQPNTISIHWLPPKELLPAASREPAIDCHSRGVSPPAVN